MRRASRLLAAAAAVAALTVPGVAQAHDHLFDGATSPGAAERGFGNPVAANPSGVAAAQARPGTVPGLGNPASGREQGTPSVDLGVLCLRLDAKADGTSAPFCD